MKLARLFILLLFAAGCDRLDVFEPVAADGGAEDAGIAPDSGFNPAIQYKPVDVLFVIDNSGSMADEQALLAQNFESFAQQIIGYVDYRVAVITTDMNSPGEQSGQFISTFESASPWSLSALDNSACSAIEIPHGCFRGSGVVTVQSSMSIEEQRSAFAANVNVGTCGSGQERGFDALLIALAESGSTGCNAGFLRPEANLVIIFVTDEEDDSAIAVEAAADQIGQIKPWAQVRVAVIGGVQDGEPSQCSKNEGAACGSLCEQRPADGSHTPCTVSTSCPAGEYCDSNRCENEDLRFWESCRWCSYYNAPDCCQALPSARYVALGRAIEDRVHAARNDIPDRNCEGLGTRVACLADTICQESYGDTMARIALELCVDPVTP